MSFNPTNNGTNYNHTESQPESINKSKQNYSANCGIQNRKSHNPNMHNYKNINQLRIGTYSDKERPSVNSNTLCNNNHKKAVYTKQDILSDSLTNINNIHPNKSLLKLEEEIKSSSSFMNVEIYNKKDLYSKNVKSRLESRSRINSSLNKSANKTINNYPEKQEIVQLDIKELTKYKK